jgi:hypothetical protein
MPVLKTINFSKYQPLKILKITSIIPPLFVYILNTQYNMTTIVISGPGSSVGIATGYGLDSPGIESQWG